jgi:hypothetical protein
LCKQNVAKTLQMKHQKFKEVLRRLPMINKGFAAIAKKPTRLMSFKLPHQVADMRAQQTIERSNRPRVVFNGNLPVGEGSATTPDPQG